MDTKTSVIRTAKAKPVFSDGEIVGIKVTDQGEGYTTTPRQIIVSKKGVKILMKKKNHG